MNIVEFLLARITEDEASSRWGRLHDDPADPESLTKILHWDHDRLRAECEAKRAIVEAVTETLALEGAGFPNDDTGYIEARSLGTFTLRSLAAVYDYHPDYPDHRDEWRP